jgi:hypothetical protein
MHLGPAERFAFILPPLMQLEGVQSMTGVEYNGLQDGATFLSEILAAGNDYSFLEGTAADLLTGGPVGKGGLSPRRAGWVITQVAASSWFQRQTILGQIWHATRTSPVLRAQDLHPLLLRAIGMLHQLMLSRYATVSSSAVDLLKSLYSWCSDLPLHGLPAIVASAGLLHSPSCGMPSEVLQEEYNLPLTREQVRCQLKTQCEVRFT